MNKELIEIVAKAIAQVSINDLNWDCYCDDALAAIRAIEGAGYKVVSRHATEDMVEAMYDAEVETKVFRASYAWEAAFDAAPTIDE